MVLRSEKQWDVVEALPDIGKLLLSYDAAVIQWIMSWHKNDMNHTLHTFGEQVTL